MASRLDLLTHIEHIVNRDPGLYVESTYRALPFPMWIAEPIRGCAYFNRIWTIVTIVRCFMR
jgi:hypothetical protein